MVLSSKITKKIFTIADIDCLISDLIAKGQPCPTSSGMARSHVLIYGNGRHTVVFQGELSFLVLPECVWPAQHLHADPGGRQLGRSDEADGPADVHAGSRADGQAA